MSVFNVQIYNKDGEGVDPARLRAAYLDRVVARAGSLFLAGLDPETTWDAKARLGMSSVYTPLRTCSATAGEPAPIGGELPERELHLLSALEQLNRFPHLVLLGDPGSGKSTFANFVALCLAGEALNRKDVNLKRLRAPLPQDDEEGNLSGKKNRLKYSALEAWRAVAGGGGFA